MRRRTHAVRERAGRDVSQLDERARMLMRAAAAAWKLLHARDDLDEAEVAVADAVAPTGPVGKAVMVMIGHGWGRPTLSGHVDLTAGEYAALYAAARKAGVAAPPSRHVAKTTAPDDAVTALARAGEDLRALRSEVALRRERLTRLGHQAIDAGVGQRIVIDLAGEVCRPEATRGATS